MVSTVWWVECLKFRQWTEKQLRRLRPKYVVLAWKYHDAEHTPTPQQVLGGDFGVSDSTLNMCYVQLTNFLVCMAYAGQWEHHNARYFGILNQWRPKVLMILDVATRSHRVPDWLAAHPTDGGTICAELKTSLLARREQALWRPMVTAVATRYRTWVLDAMDFVCGRVWCPCVVSDRLVMWDSNHVTYQFVEFLAPNLLANLMAQGYFQP
jgi:hypothetical protein